MPASVTVSGTYNMVMVLIKNVAEVMFDQMYKHHRMPSHIVSNKDSLFTVTQLASLGNTEEWAINKLKLTVARADWTSSMFFGNWGTSLRCPITKGTWFPYPIT